MVEATILGRIVGQVGWHKKTMTNFIAFIIIVIIIMHMVTSPSPPLMSISEQYHGDIKCV